MIAEKQNELLKLLKEHYGFNDFRIGQKEAIDNILYGKSTMLVMPTGGGKSLCYQLPALVLDGVTIVISPLIALMKDQVDSLQRLSIKATFINSAISPQEANKRLEEVKNGEYKLLYIAPERFYNYDFLNSLNDLQVSLFAIDEAHCISQWGHDFRPSYLKLKEAIKKVKNPPIIALTATATPEVRRDIIKQLDLINPEVIITGFARPNLQFGVIHASENQKPDFVLDAVNSVSEGIGIVYVGTRARADKLLQFLLENDIEAISYHAGMDPNERRWVQENFTKGKAKVIVATNAFGLGIDKADVRYVIHFDMPGTIEAYYQEAGRAGRDGKPSFCLLLYNSRDRHLQEFFIKGDNPPSEIILEIYDFLLSFEQNVVMITYSEIMEVLNNSVPDMAIGTSLKILEREGYIIRSHDKQASAYLKFLEDKESVLNIFGKRAKKQIEIVEKLFDKFSNELYRGWDVNLEEVAGVLDIKKDSISRLIRKVVENRLAEYTPPFKGTKITILKRVSKREVNINKEALLEKANQAYKKLDKMEDYIYADDCRQKFILNYFGEFDVKHCGKCDLCLTGKSIHAKKKEIEDEKIIEIKNIEYSVIPDNKGLNTKLTQLETFDLYNKGFSIKEIAQKRDLTIDEVQKHIDFLTKKGLIKDKK
jgi:ATP-dependent DNA helicase RecQ